MAAPTERVCGWIDRKEFQNVYEWLYSGDTDEQEHALHKIALWKCRVLQKLSTAIECTAQLVLASIEDKKLHSMPGIADDHALRLNYSMALVRFINLITEKGQNKMYAKPVHCLAEELGVPEWIVDLRHEATHGNLPSLPIMKIATEFALNWLKEEYWESMFDGADSYTADTFLLEEKLLDMKKDLKMHLELFMDIQLNNFKNKDESEKTSNLYKKSLKAVLYKIKPFLVQYGFEAFSVLVTSGVFILTSDQLDVLKKGLSHDLLVSTDVILPKVVVRLLKPLLKMIHALDLTPLLLQTLMSKFSEKKSLADCLLVGWVATMLSSLRSLECADVSHCGVVIYEESCTINAELLLQLCLVAPSGLTSKLLPLLFQFQNPPVTKEKQEKLISLVKIYSSPPTAIVIDGATQDLSDDEVKTLGDVLSGHDNLMTMGGPRC